MTPEEMQLLEQSSYSFSLMLSQVENKILGAVLIFIFLFFFGFRIISSRYFKVFEDSYLSYNLGPCSSSAQPESSPYLFSAKNQLMCPGTH